MSDDMKAAAAADHNVLATEQADAEKRAWAAHNKSEADRKAEDARAQQSFHDAPVMRDPEWQAAERHVDTAPPPPNP